MVFTVQCCLKKYCGTASVLRCWCHDITVTRTPCSTLMNSLPKKANLHSHAVVRVVIHRGEKLRFVVLPGLARAHPVLRFGGWEGEVLPWVRLSGDRIRLWTGWRRLLLLDKHGKDRLDWAVKVYTPFPYLFSVLLLVIAHLKRNVERELACTCINQRNVNQRVISWTDRGYRHD